MVSYFFFLFAACVSADAATLFTAAGDFGLLRSLDALLATFAEVFSLVCFFAVATLISR